MDSKTILYAAVCLACMCLASARPRYVLVPIDDYEEAESQPQPVFLMPRMARALEPLVDDLDEPQYIRPQLVRQAPRLSTEESRLVRQAAGGPGYGGDDYVDYGAYTGKHGAFGWYTDHPVGGGHRR